MRSKRTLFISAALAALILLVLAACGGDETETPPPGQSYGPGPTDWSGPPYAARCDMETLTIEAESPGEEHRVNDALMALDVPLYITGALYDPTAKTAYDAHEAGPREMEFRWALMSRYFSHFAPEGQVEFGTRLAVSRTAAEDCWNAWLRREEGEALPPVPASMAGAVALNGDTYSIEPTEGIYPGVSLIFAYLDTDVGGGEVLTVYADVLWAGAGEPHTVEIVLLRRADGAYILQHAGSADPEADLYVRYELTAYRAAVYLPADCALVEENAQGASFASPTGLTVDIYEESFRGHLSDRHADELSEIGGPLFEFGDNNRLEYGIIWDDGAGLCYSLVRQMEPNNLVRVRAAVPYDWAWDYFSLAEALFGSFGGAEFPVDVVLELEEYVMGILSE